MKQGFFVFDSGLECGTELLKMNEPPTAIFASNDDMAAGVLMAAHQRGISVPGDLSVAGFDDAQVARFVWPRLTTVFQPAYDLAYSATGMLLQLLKQPPKSSAIAHSGAHSVAPSIAPPKSQLFGYRLVCRDSTGPLRPRDASSPAAGE